MGFPGSAVVKNLPANAGDVRDLGSIPGSGRSPGGGNGNPLWCSCLDNSMNRGTWWGTVHGVSWRPWGLKEWEMTNYTFPLIIHQSKKMIFMIFSFSCIFTHPFLQGQLGTVCFFTAKVLAKSKENCLCHFTKTVSLCL